MRLSLAPLSIVMAPLAALSILYFTIPVLAPLIMAHAGARPEDFGWVGGAIGFGSVWFCTANQAITPTLGPVRTLRLGVLIAVIGIGAILTGVWPLILAGGVMVGFGYGTTAPAGSQILADFTPKANWGFLFSVRQAGVPIGGMTAGALAAVLVLELGWRPTLEIVAVLAATIGLGLLLVPARYNESRPLQPFSFKRLLSPANVISPFRTVVAMPQLASLFLAGAGFAMVHGAVTTFFVIYLHTGLGIALPFAGLLFAVLQLFAIIGRIAFGLLADAIGAPIPVLKVLAPCSAACALVLANFPIDASDVVMSALAALIGLAIGTWNGLYMAEIARLAPDRVSDASAAAGFFSFFIYMLTPPLVAWLSVELGYRNAFACLVAPPLLAFCVLMLRGRGRKPAAPVPIAAE